VLAATQRRAILQLEWDNFHALPSIGLDFDSMEAMVKDHSLEPMTALLLADGGKTPLNLPEWVQR
jgi:hypothetical protein